MAQSNSSDSIQMEVVEVCLHFPSKIYTPGMRLGLPMLIAELATEIILGQTILGNEKLLGKRNIAYSDESVQVLGTVSAFGYMFFLFLSTVKMDLSMIRKVGNKALCIGFLSVILPLLSGFLVDLTLVSPQGEDVYARKNKSFFLAILYSGSSFSVIHCLLSDLMIINSELGRLCLSAAMTSDISSMILMNISYLMQISHDLENKTMVRHTPEGGPIRDVFIYAIIVLFLISPKFSSWFHVFSLFGPMIVGLVIPDGPPMGSALVEKFERFVNGLFLPLFVTTCAMRVDFFQLDFSNVSTSNQVIASLVILAVKFGVSLTLPFYCDMPKRDSIALAFIMNAKGIVELGSFSIMNDHLFTSASLFAFLIIIIIIMAVASPILVKLLYDPSRKYASYWCR
ncbi:hypothetical protein SLEP1_g59125 [Rubroshorea leprosula]|uniref:Cation/H+ exchanger transmembrane domain-containing protein n=1 Tax=Rubroshorea leprosula TaxID=152421 RepID=A0AAV5MUN1_9ROSI|nr:hypothetical protein SLEP1_g59125 [Rubroshorea leprosula]